MSSNPNANAASTYQTIVIAIVAGGILSTGVLSILWKRRQARRWIAMRRNMPAGLATTVGGTSGMGARSDGLGREPGIWDVVFGGEDEKRTEGEKGTSEGEKAGEEDVDLLDLKGEMKSGWRPASLSISTPRPLPSLASNPPPPNTSHTAEITVLIAMPQQEPTLAAVSPSSSPNDPQISSPPDYSSIYYYPTTTSQITDDLDDEDGRHLPLLEMGLTSIPVSAAPPSTRSKPSPTSIEGMMKKAAEEREEASKSRRHRSRSTAWDGIPVVQANQVGGFQGTGIDPLTNPSAASRYAMIRNGALAGFGSPSGRGLPGARA